MYPELNHPQYRGKIIFPADILLRIRERGEISHIELRDQLGIHPSPSDFRNGHLLHILRNLGEADLIEVVGSLPNEQDLRRDFVNNELVGFLTNLEESDLKKALKQMNVDSISSLLPKECVIRVTPHLQKIQTGLELSLHHLCDQSNVPHGEATERIQRMADDLEYEMPDVGYKADTIASFRELGDCLQSRCYIATLALGGKLLELAVKHHMITNGQDFEDNWMLGTLLQKMKENAEVYQDPSLRNVATIINTSRIPAVHAKREIPIPSEEQALMVVNAVLDVTRRLVIASTPGEED